MAQSLLRRMKHKALKEVGLTWTERVKQSLITRERVTRVEFEVVGNGSNRRLEAKEVL